MVRATRSVKRTIGALRVLQWRAPSLTCPTPNLRRLQPQVAVLALLLVCIQLLAMLACAPVLPERSKPGGAARWAAALAQHAAVAWAEDAQVCRITGTGVGADGWLPDRGGNWTLSYWSPHRDEVLEATVNSDGVVTTQSIKESAARGRTLPADWSDSPRVWAATLAHQRGEALSTFEAELAVDAEPERYPGQAVWRIRFFMEQSSFETHVVSADAKWVSSY